MNVRLSLKVVKLEKTFKNILQSASWVPFLYLAKYNIIAHRHWLILLNFIKTCCQVWHLGRCSKCAAKPKSEVFLSHVLAVLRHLRIRHPHVQPVMWDDMLRTISQSDIEGKDILLITVDCIHTCHSSTLPFSCDVAKTSLSLSDLAWSQRPKVRRIFCFWETVYALNTRNNELNFVPDLTLLLIH